MISKTTIVKALKRFGSVAVASGLISFSMIAPMNFRSLKDVKIWALMAISAFGTGFIAGLQKAIKGYYKYDK